MRGWVAGGSVTLVKSHAKALLTLRIKSALALSEGERGARRGLGTLPMAYRPHDTDNARDAGAQGSGLGLAIAKWIVDSHGGVIGVTSVEGVGSRFTIRLPR